jgi:transposase
MTTSSASNENTKHVDDSIRKLILRKYEGGCSLLQIATDIELKYSTVQSIIRKFKKTGVIESEKNKCGRKKKIGPNEETIIRSEISNDCSITLENIKNKINLVTGNEISIPTIHRSLRDFEYSFKRVQLIPERRNSMSNIEARFIYARNTMLIDV